MMKTDQVPGRIVEGGRRVLLVEDEDSLRRALAKYLRATGHFVVEAEGGKEAIALVEQAQEPFELLITDMLMPKMNGASVAAAVRSRAPEVRVIFMSGYTEDDPFRLAVASEARSEFIQKPFSMDSLSKAISRLFA